MDAADEAAAYLDARERRADRKTDLIIRLLVAALLAYAASLAAGAVWLAWWAYR